MAQIRPYISQQEAQQQLQNTNTPSQPGDFGGQGLANIGEGISNLAQGVFQGQKLIYDRKVRDETSRAHLDSISAHTEIAKEVEARTKAWKPGEPMPSTVMPDRMKSILDSRNYNEDGTSRFETPEAASKYQQLAARSSQHFTDVLRDTDSKLAGDAAKHTHEQLKTSLAGHVFNNPDQVEMAKLQASMAIEDPNGIYGQIPRRHIQPLIDEAHKEIATSYAQGLIEQDPQRALVELRANDPRSPLRLLEPSHIPTLVDKAESGIKAREQDARLLETEERRKEADLHKDTDRKNMALFLDPKTRNQVTPSTLSKQAERGELDGPTARATNNFIMSDPAERKKLGDDKNYEALFNRVILPWGHKDKINDTATIYAEAARLHLSVPHTKALIKDFHDGRTVDGDGLLKNRADHLKAIKRSITNSNPLLNKEDPEGDMKYGDYQAFVQDAEQKRIEANLSPFDLYNPKHADYIGKQVGPYLKTMNESMKTVAGNMRRKPVEAPKDPLEAVGYDVSTFGKRDDGTPKGTGWFGVLNNRKNGGVSTELSTDDPIDASGKKVQHPLLVPTLTRREIEHLLGGGKDASMEKAIYEKAAAHARKRLSSGLSPYPGPSEQVALPPPTSTGAQAPAAVKPAPFTRLPGESAEQYLDRKAKAK